MFREEASLTRRVALTGLLGALALTLSFLESLLPPLPVPGARLGLSNLATMTALSALGLPAALTITLAKALFALLRGGTAFWMSLCGGVLSTLAMALCMRLLRGHIGAVGVGILGAVAHNAGQLAAAMVLFDDSLLVYAPWLLIAAVAAGTATGLVLRVVLPRVRGLCIKNDIFKG